MKGPPLQRSDDGGRSWYRVQTRWNCTDTRRSMAEHPEAWVPFIGALLDGRAVRADGSVNVMMRALRK